MNPTIVKFGHPRTLVREFVHWVVLLRPAQVTLGTLVLAARSDASAFHELPPAAFAELHEVIGTIEQSLAAFRPFERINYLMLMMVDRQVHFHVIPRYAEPQTWGDVTIGDAGWPAAPDLGSATALTEAQQAELTQLLRGYLR